MAEVEKFTIGKKTEERVFKVNGITDLSDLQRLLDAVEAALSTDAQPVAGKLQVHYAYCCSGSTKYCDCVNKNHGTAWIGANEVGDDYIPVVPPAPSVAVNTERDIAAQEFLLNEPCSFENDNEAYIKGFSCGAYWQRSALSAQAQGEA